MLMFEIETDLLESFFFKKKKAKRKKEQKGKREKDESLWRMLPI